MQELSPEERDALRDEFAKLLSRQSAEADVRRAMATPTGYDPALWHQLARMGILGLLVAPEHGGIGAGPLELGVIMEEAGAALLCAPFMASAVLATGLLGASSDAAAQARLLPAMATGERIATVAFTGPHGTWTPEGVAVTATQSGASWQLSGTSSFVLNGMEADILLVVAKVGGELAAFEVDPTAIGLTRTPQETLDRTLRLARFDFQSTPAIPLAGGKAAAIDAALDLGRVALAAEQAGGARRVFDFTMDYLKTRVQFGRPIGGFQALKHMAADLLIEVESATSAARQAAQSLARNAATLRADIALAAFACADAYSDMAAAAIQMHGGIAFTWEHPAHLYLRRARADAMLLGQSDHYRDQFITALELAR